MKAKFLRHEGYLGAMGGFISTPLPASVPESPVRTPLYIIEDFSKTEKLGVDSLTSFGRLQTLDVALVPLNCLRGKYTSDTIDISGDVKAREYWITLLEKNVGRYTKMAGEFPEEGDANEFEALFQRQLGMLRYSFIILMFRDEPGSYGRISISGMLSLREQCLREAGFRDVFKLVKEQENMEAVKALRGIIAKVDAVVDERERVEKLIENVLGGNSIVRDV
jgi:hypothetical protein